MLAIQKRCHSHLSLKSLSLFLTRLLLIGALGVPGLAAAAPGVNSVPWVPANRLIPHDAWSGKEVTLKAVADVQGSGFVYTWDFGDGTPTVSGTVTNRYVVEARHSYIGSPGDVFTARITIEDTATGETGTDTYFVQIREQTLETEVNVAIDEGLWYLHRWQTRTTEGGIEYGDWRNRTGCSGCSRWLSITAANINAFAAQGHAEAGFANNPYTETVQRAMRRLFTYLRTETISNRTYPVIGSVNPDSNGNGLGVRVNQGNYPYQGGMFIDAIITAGQRDAVTSTGPNGIVGRTYAEIVQDMVDSYAFGQYNVGINRGGWRYVWNQGPDNSAAQWGAIGLIPAERLWGLSVPDWVKSQNEIWLAFSQRTTGSESGRYGYSNVNPSGWGPYAVTPSGMVQMVMDGIGRGDTRWDQSETWLRDRFGNSCTSSSPRTCARTAIKDYYYGLFSFVKSMRLHEPPIELLSSQTAGVTPLDWYAAELAQGAPTDGVARMLVNEQQADGRWINNYYSVEQQPFDTAWAILMLGQTLFEAGSPVAVAEALPNPAVAGQTIVLDGAASFHQDPERDIVDWEWDLDNDGVFEVSGVRTSTSYPVLGDYPVTLRVTDDGLTPRVAETTISIRITLPPVAPTANANGPYNFCPGQTWFLDGTGSVNPDEGLSEPGAPGDTIASYAWDLQGSGSFADAIGPQPNVSNYFDTLGVGDYLVRLRVTDTTAASFPSSGQPDLTDTDAAQVRVRDAADAVCSCISDLVTRPKSGKVQLVWTDTGATMYNVYRGTTAGGPYQFLATTDSRYSTYLDQSVVNETQYHYVVRETTANGTERCQSGESSATPTASRRSRNSAPVVVSAPATAAVVQMLYAYDADAIDANGDDITYALDVAPVGMTIDADDGLIQWTPVAAQLGAQNVTLRVSDPAGASTTQTWQVLVTDVNAPPAIISSPVVNATEGALYNYDVDAIDSNIGDVLTYSLDVAPGGMTIDPSSGLVQWTPNNGQVGPGAVTVRVTDAGGLSDTQAFTVLVVELNLAPSITSSPITSAVEGAPYAYDVEATDPNSNDMLTFSLLNAPTGMSIDDVSGLVEWTPDNAQVGNVNVVVQADDGNGGFATQSYTIVVAPANLAPTITSVPVTAATTGLLYAYDVAATDPNSGDVLTYSLDLAPTGMGIDAATGLIQWTPVANQIGAQAVTVRVADGNGGFATQSYSISVVEPNLPPSIVSSPVVDAVEGELYSYDVDATDPNGSDVLNFVLDTAPVGMSIDDVSGLIQWTPTSTQIGSQSVVVRVEDGSGGVASQSFSISVVEANQSPVITSVPITTASVDALYGYDVAATDPNSGDVLSYSLDLAPAGMSIDAVTGLVQWIPVTNQIGSQAVTVRVIDGNGGFATQSYTIAVGAANQPPTITSAPQTNATTSVLYQYDVDATDPDGGDVLTFSLDSAPAGMTIDSANGLIQWTPDVAQVGTNSVTVRVVDGRGGFATQSFSIVVVEFNSAPSITSVPVLEGTQDQLYSYDANANDAEGDALTYSLDVAPIGMTIDPASGLVEWTPSGTQVGAQSVMLRVTDDGALFDTQSFDVVVANVNDAPIAEAGPDQTVFVGVSAALDGSASSDLDGDALTFSWAITSAPQGSTAALTNSNTVFPSFTPDLPGNYIIDLVVNDGTIDSAIDSVTISTENSAPVADAGPDQSTIVSGVVQLDGSSSLDVDGDGLSYSWSFTDLPTNSSAVLSGADTAFPNFVADAAGSYTIQLIVNDGLIDSAPDLVLVSTQNTAPIADPGADQNVTLGDLVMLDGSASFDVDLDALTYVWSLVGMPTGSTVSLSASDTPFPTFTPDLAGLYTAQLVVADGTVAGVPATVNIFVGGLPVATPDVVGLAQAVAEADVAAAGLAVGNIITQSSDTVPAGNVISQDPLAGTIVPSDTPVDLVISSGQAAPDEQLPFLELTFNAFPAIYNPGEMIVLTVDGSDESGSVSATGTLDGSPIPIVLPTTVIDTTGLPAGSQHTISVTVSDGAGNEVTETVSFVIRDPGDVTPPNVVISSPLRDAEISDAVPVIGTVTDDGTLLEYRLELSPANQNDFTLLERGTAEIVNDFLGNLEPAQLLNEIYDLRLVAIDAGGNAAATQIAVMVDGDLKVGNFSFSIEDLRIPVSGIPITVTRTYDTRQKDRELDFGFGWSIDYQDVRVRENSVAGEDWSQTSSGGFFPTYCVAPTSSHRVVVSLPTGRVEEFEMGLATACQQLVPLRFVNPIFEALPGTFSTLVPEDVGQLLVNGNVLLDTGTVQPYDPRSYTLTTVDGMVWQLDENFGVRSVTDPDGNTLTYGSNGIVHSSGASIAFTRDGQGRITEITDPNGNVLTYTYDGAGDLVAVTDGEGSQTTHVYNRRHGLVEYLDPLGVQPARNIYDLDGMLIALVDPDGNRVEITRDLDANTEIVRDRNGNQTIYSYDGRGNVTSRTNALGETETLTYDANGNELTVTDALGNTVTRTYDARDNTLSTTDALGNTIQGTFNNTGRPLTQTDGNGNVRTLAYNGTGNATQTIDPLGGVNTLSYNLDGDLTSRLDEVGNTTSFTYNGEGHLLSETDAAGVQRIYTVDGNGNRLSETVMRSDGSGGLVPVVQTWEYDANNQVVRTVDGLGGVAVNEYDAAAQLVAEIDANGNRTEFSYDPRGDLIRTRFPDGTVELIGYDAEGNETSRTDRGGRTTTMFYDAANRLIETVFPDGSSTQQEYDAAGRVVAEIDENGGRSVFTLDPNGRQLSVVDPLGNVQSFTYDANGNVLTETDALGNVTTHEYDGMDRETRTVFPDGSETRFEYNAAHRKTAEIDSQGNRVEFAYDPLGRLASITDALNNTTTHTYDELGNRLTTTDGAGRVTLWSYDNLGRQLSRTLPEGQTEVFTYDANGNMLTYTDFNGSTTTFVYDVMDQVVRKDMAGGITESWTYTPTGMVASTTDARGTTAHTYDARDRLLRVDNPDSTFITYVYDPSGNRTAITTPAGTTAYAYDSLHRNVQVTDEDGGITAYFYDASGNQIGIDHPNGTSTVQTYDNRNRVTNVVHTDVLTQPLATYDYTLDVVGNRVRIDDEGGRVVQYGYDANYRLISEEVIETGGATSFLATYTYDAVGNRLTQTLGGGLLTTYVFDDNDRLLSETSGGSVVTYTYDANGNQLTQSAGGVTTTNTWDVENQLISTITPTDSIMYSYDVEGNRIGSTENGTALSFLVDKNLAFAEVLADYDPLGTFAADGSADALYVHGTTPISQSRNGVRHVYHNDALGSVRALTDEAGVLSDSYRFAAFGDRLGVSGSTPNPYQFAGERLDESTGLYHLRARYYSPQSGRLISQDPFAGFLFKPQSLNKYIYADNNPALLTDPSGLFSMASVSVSLNVQTTLRTGAIRTATFKGRKGVVKKISCVVGTAYIKKEFVGDGLEGHHSIPKNLGGDPSQALIFLPANTHRMFHWVLNVVLKDVPEFKGMGNWTSKMNWDKISRTKKGREALYKAILRASKLVDKFCRLKGPASLAKFVRANRKNFVGG